MSDIAQTIRRRERCGIATEVETAAADEIERQQVRIAYLLAVIDALKPKDQDEFAEKLKWSGSRVVFTDDIGIPTGEP